MPSEVERFCFEFSSKNVYLHSKKPWPPATLNSAEIAVFQVVITIALVMLVTHVAKLLDVRFERTLHIIRKIWLSQGLTWDDKIR